MSCCHQAELVSKRVWLAHLNKQRDCSTTRPLNFACLWQTSGCYLWSSSLSQTRYWAAFFRNTYKTFIAGCHDHNNKWQQQRVEIFMQTLVESGNSLVVQLTLRSVNRGWGVTQDGDKAGGLEFVQCVRSHNSRGWMFYVTRQSVSCRPLPAWVDEHLFKM